MKWLAVVFKTDAAVHVMLIYTVVVLLLLWLILFTADIISNPLMQDVL